jgi:hypothetical protein
MWIFQRCRDAGRATRRHLRPLTRDSNVVIMNDFQRR